jgi:hypothetical protein
MLERLSSRRGSDLACVHRRLGDTRLILALGAAYLVSQATIASILHDLDPVVVLRLQTTLSVEVFTSILDRWRAAGLLPTYWRHYWLDFPHPFLYGTLLAAALARAFDANGLDARFDRLLLVPFVAGALDLVENLCHVAMLLDTRLVTAPMVVASGLAANLKWIGALGSTVAVPALFAHAWWRRRQTAGSA